jgi:molybdopterin-synthase adenylyltransferase
MKVEVVLTSEILGTAKTHLLQNGQEGALVVLASQSSSGRSMRLLGRDVVVPSESEYVRRGALEAELSPTFVARATNQARAQGLSMIFMHSHPGSDAPSFSAQDDAGEDLLAEFLDRRHPGEHGAIVLSAGGIRGRRLGRRENASVIEVGANRVAWSVQEDGGYASSPVYDRQVRAFGTYAQSSLGRLRVAVVGLGGTGSLVVQQLSHLGVKNFLLIDPDIVEATNLNRLSHATSQDIGIDKVFVARRQILALAPSATVTTSTDDVVRARVAIQLKDVDFIFACTDSHGSRSVIQQIAYQYLIPCVDMGTTIVATGAGQVRHVHGRVQLLSAGLPCLHCTGLLNSAEVRRDMMSHWERQLDPYIVGHREPAPAVISINSTVSSLAVTMFLQCTVGLPGDSRYLLYDAIRSSVRPVKAARDKDCFICSPSGVLGKGDALPLMARQD